MIQLAGYLFRHGKALEASLAYRYPRDADQLDQFWTGEMSLRRLQLLVEYLPRNAPLHEEISGAEEAYWTPDLRMSASIHEQLQYVAYVIGAVNVDKFKGKKNPVPEPKPIPRPGVETTASGKSRKGKLVFGGKNPSPRHELEAFFGRPQRGRD